MKPLAHRFRKKKTKPVESLPGLHRPTSKSASSPSSPTPPTSASSSSPSKSSTAPSSSSTTQQTHWGNVAGWYDGLVGDSGSEYHQQVVIPGALRLLGIGPGDVVLDLACGQGVLCRTLHERGAKIVGVDASPQLLQAARDRGPADISYLLADARNLAPVLTPNYFSAAVCMLAIQNIDPLPPVFQGIANALQIGGRFLLIMMHPCFRIPKQAHWEWDREKHIQYRRIDRYLLPSKESIYVHPGLNPHQQVWAFHRPLQAYIKALAACGLYVDHLEEWPSHKTSDSGPRANAENKARQEIPLFLALRTLKIKSTQPLPNP